MWAPRVELLWLLFKKKQLKQATDVLSLKRLHHPPLCSHSTEGAAAVPCASLLLQACAGAGTASLNIV